MNPPPESPTTTLTHPIPLRRAPDHALPRPTQPARVLATPPDPPPLLRPSASPTQRASGGALHRRSRRSRRLRPPQPPLSLDPTQAAILSADPHRVLVCCTRQWGKSTTAAIKALHHALTVPASLTLLASRTLTQSSELLRKIAAFARPLQVRTARAPGHDASLQFPNHSRIIALPGDPASIRGLSAASLLIVDEAGFVSDPLYHALRPTLATTNGAVWLLSTPNGPRGFFFDEYNSTNDWTRFEVNAYDCPRISAEFLEEEKRKLGPARFEQEYMCRFSAQAGSFFDLGSFHTAPLPGLHDPERADEPRYIVGFDLGQRDSHSAVVVLEMVDINSQQRDPVTWEWVVSRQVYVRGVERFPLNISYPDTARMLKKVIDDLPSRRYAHLMIDYTGSGAPFYDVLNRLGHIGCDVDKLCLIAGGRVSWKANKYLPVQ
ncbi:MAG: terminase family protein [Bryobacteraceae bacterium]